MIMFFPATLTQLGQFKYGLLRDKVTGVVDLQTSYTPGWYWIGFWKEFVEFPSTLNTIEFSDEGVEEGVQDLAPLRSRDKDGKLIFLDVSIQYLLAEKNIGKLYKDMLTYYEDIFISELRDQIAKAANGFAVQDIWGNYRTVVDLMKEKCRLALEMRHAECWGLQLWGVKLSSEYETKLIQTQVRKQAQKTALASKRQEQVRADTRVLVAQYNKDIQVLKAAGDAQVYSIETLARSTASSNLVQAQADSLQIVRDRVCTTYAMVANETNGTTEMICGTSGNGTMSGMHMVEYEKQILLKKLGASQLVVSQPGSMHPNAKNVEASRILMKDGLMAMRPAPAPAPPPPPPPPPPDADMATPEDGGAPPPPAPPDMATPEDGGSRRLLLHYGREPRDLEDFFNENSGDFSDSTPTTFREL